MSVWAKVTSQPESTSAGIPLMRFPFESWTPIMGRGKGLLGSVVFGNTVYLYLILRMRCKTMIRPGYLEEKNVFVPLSLRFFVHFEKSSAISDNPFSVRIDSYPLILEFPELSGQIREIYTFFFDISHNLTPFFCLPCSPTPK